MGQFESEQVSKVLLKMNIEISTKGKANAPRAIKGVVI